MEVFGKQKTPEIFRPGAPQEKRLEARNYWRQQTDGASFNTIKMENGANLGQRQIDSRTSTKTKIAARKLDNFYVLIRRAGILLIGLLVKKRRKEMGNKIAKKKKDSK